MNARAPRPPFARARIVGRDPLGLSLARALLARGGARTVEWVAENSPRTRSAEALGLELLADPGEAEPPDALFVTSWEPEEALSRWIEAAPAALIHAWGEVQRPWIGFASRMRQRLPDLRFVGGHPLVERGAGNPDSEDDVFVGTNVILCAPPETSPAARSAIERTWQLLGAIPVFLSAEEHDRWVALTEQLPVLAASELARLARESLALDGLEEMLVGPTFREITRSCLAGSGPLIEAWTRNADQLAPLARRLARALEQAAGQLESGPAFAPGALHGWLEPAVTYRRRFGDE